MADHLAPKDLSAWLTHIEQLHPKSIEMGLARVQAVIQRLALHPNFNIITVAGTNGKGSTCAMLAEIYQQAGYQVGSYSSPHLVRYNERVKVNGVEATDAALCDAFAAVDAARLGACADEAIPLTYFEVGTLAAIWHFCQLKLDVAILEIGLGGRLDAVNAFEPDCAIITSVDLDHQEFLGDTRELIGREKAGVYRAHKPAICGDANPPNSVLDYAAQIQADFKAIHQAFDYVRLPSSWQFITAQQVRYTLPLPALQGDYQFSNAACVLSAVEALQNVLPVAEKAIAQAMRQVQLAGRFQAVSQTPLMILDVAHNPHAARALAENLRALNMRKPTGRTIAVFAMLSDKDIAGVIDAVHAEVDDWYVANIDHVRGAAAGVLSQLIHHKAPAAKIKTFASAAHACKQACIDAHENDKIIVFGSFFTVSSVMQYLSAQPHITL